MKFGGTSMKDAATIRRAAGIARSSAGDRPVVAVVSAMDQVTELLLDLAHASSGGREAESRRLISEIRSKHQAAASDLAGAAPAHIAALLDRLERLASGLLAVGELTPRSMDLVVAFGEMLSTQLMASAMECRGFTGQEVGIVTDDLHGKAAPLMDLSLFQIRQTLAPVLATDRRAVVSGFIAATQHGVITTLGRGGSDYTACILGSALKAHEIWIWSDVDGLMSTDPRLVATAKLLDCVTFAEAIEMGQFGAKSMHPLALEPAAENAIPVRMRNTFKPESQGTLIVPERPDAGDGAPVKCVLLLKNAAMIGVTGAAMIGRPGTAAAVFRALAEARVNIMMISQSVSEAGISLVIAKDAALTARSVLEHALMRSGSAKSVTLTENIAVVAAVGSGMHGTPGIAARLFSAIAHHKINVMAIAQGSSELSISLVVEASAGPEAVKALHAEFVG